MSTAKRGKPKPRTPLVVSVPVSGFVGEAPISTVPHRDFILSGLERAARDFCSTDEVRQRLGKRQLAHAADLIARLDAREFFRVCDARQKRPKKAMQAELVALMRTARSRDKTLKEFLRGCPDLQSGGPPYVFNLVSGEYQIADLRDLWAKAGKAPEPDPGLAT